MKFASQVGLALLLNLAVVSGGDSLGVAEAKPPVAAPKSADAAQAVFDEGKKLALRDPESSRKAIEKFKQSLQLSQQSHNLLLQANSLAWLGMVHFSLDENPQSLEFYTQALPIFQTLGDRLNEAGALQRIGDIYTRLGENQKALKVLKESLLLYKSSNAPAWNRAHILYEIGQVYTVLGDKQSALESFTESLPIWKMVDASNQFTLDSLAPDLYLEALSRIADIYSNLGDKQKALDTYYKILVAYIAPELPVDENLKIRLIYDAKAERENLRFLNDFFEASSYQSDSDPIDAGGRLLALNRIGRLFLDLGSNELALRCFNLAEMAYMQAESMDATAGLRLAATTLNNRGLAYSGLDQTQKALAAFDLALDHRRVLRDLRSEAIILRNKGVLYSTLGDRKQALALYRQALPLSQAVGDRETEATLFYNMASTYYSQRQLTEALPLINSAIALIESLRSDFKNDALKTAYFTTVQGYYQLKTEILMQLHRQQPTQGYNAKALETVDQSRARVLRELLIQANANINKDISPELLTQAQTLNQTLDAKEKQLVQFSSEPSKAAQLPALKQEIAALYTQRDALKNTIRATNPAYANLQYPQPATLVQIQQQLDPDTLMLQYSLGDTESYLWVIGQTSLKTYILPKRSDIKKTVDTFHQELQLPAPQSALDLTAQILTPAATALGTKRLVIIPDGELHTIPFAALNLPNSTTYTPLITQHEITNLPSASTIGILRSTVATKPRAPKQLAILADPIFTKDDDRLLGKATSAKANLDLNEQRARNRAGRSLENLIRLRGTATEAQGILKLVSPADSTSAFGFDASYDWITDPKISQYRYVHLATHGFFDNEQPALSSIILSSFDAQGRDRKAYLRLPELFNLNLPTELVVLSACETGLGKDTPGEGIIGMTRGLMYAGALRVAVSLWSVNDQATSDLMQDFYQNLWQSKHSHAASLRYAQLALWKQGKAPYYWAAFTLQGEWRN